MKKQQQQTCCACGVCITDRVNYVHLNRTAPIPGSGWGCATCNMPKNGAIAVLCDSCLDAGAPIRFVVRGVKTSAARIGVDGYRHHSFEHDTAAHVAAKGL